GVEREVASKLQSTESRARSIRSGRGIEAPIPLLLPWASNPNSGLPVQPLMRQPPSIHLPLQLVVLHRAPPVAHDRVRVEHPVPLGVLEARGVSIREREQPEVVIVPDAGDHLPAAPVLGSK